MPASIDLINQVFGRLTVRGKSAVRSSGNVVWVCDCRCGKSVNVPTRHLKDGRTKSCGCLKLDLMVIHGASSQKGDAHPLYRIWLGMKARCYNKNTRDYPDYGGRGITVCDKWRDDYSAFRDYMLGLENCPINAEINGAFLDRTIDRIKKRSGI